MKKKQILAISLAVIMVCSSIDCGVFASESDDLIIELQQEDNFDISSYDTVIEDAEDLFAENDGQEDQQTYNAETVYEEISSIEDIGSLSEDISVESQSDDIQEIQNDDVPITDDTVPQSESVEIVSDDVLENIAGTSELPENIVEDEIAVQEISTDSEMQDSSIHTIEVEYQENIDLSDLPDNEELHKEYISRLFDTSGIQTYAEHGRKYLNETSLIIYNTMREHIESIAAGEESSTRFECTDINISYTYEEMGIDSTATKDEVMTAFASLFYEDFSFSLVFDYLISDCPYDLYWYDKYSKVTLGYDIDYIEGNSAWISKVLFLIPVSNDYQDGDIYKIDIEKTSVANKAAENAHEIVAKHNNETEWERLNSYKQEICDLVSYDDDASVDNNMDYGNPWQLVYVFDGDESTNVVSEGYAKAFQYLCDLDNGNELCYLVTGTFSPKKKETHTWNIVKLEGTNYLVDVTNSDTGTVGENGGLFLITGSNATDISYDENGVPSYTFTLQDTSVTYTYDWYATREFPLSVLTLDTTALEDLSYYDIVFPEEEYRYCGTAMEPAVLVTNGTTILTLNEDYRISYNNNIFPGTASVIITGMGDYTGNKEEVFTILPADISEASAELSITNYVYDGTAKEPVVSEVTYGDLCLIENEDYTISYENNIDAGTASVLLTGIGNYTGTLSLEFTIDKMDQSVTAQIGAEEIAYGDMTAITAESTFSNSFSYDSTDCSARLKAAG